MSNQVSNIILILNSFRYRPTLLDHCSMFMFLISNIICKTEVYPAYFQYLSMHFLTWFDHKRGGEEGMQQLVQFLLFFAASFAQRL